MKNTIEILERMNEWRRYDGLMLDGPEMPCPKEFGLAIDDAVRKLRAADAVADNLAAVIKANMNEGATRWSVDDAQAALDMYNNPSTCRAS